MMTENLRTFPPERAIFNEGMTPVGGEPEKTELSGAHDGWKNSCNFNPTIIRNMTTSSGTDRDMRRKRQIYLGTL